MIRFLDLPAEYHVLKTEIDAAVAQVFESGQYVGGPRSPRSKRNSPAIAARVTVSPSIPGLARSTWRCSRPALDRATK